MRQPCWYRLASWRQFAVSSPRTSASPQPKLKVSRPGAEARPKQSQAGCLVTLNFVTMQPVPPPPTLVAKGFPVAPADRAEIVGGLNTPARWDSSIYMTFRTICRSKADRRPCGCFGARANHQPMGVDPAVCSGYSGLAGLVSLPRSGQHFLSSAATFMTRKRTSYLSRHGIRSPWVQHTGNTRSTCG